MSARHYAREDRAREIERRIEANQCIHCAAQFASPEERVAHQERCRFSPAYDWRKRRRA